MGEEKAGMAHITLKGLSKRYGSDMVVRDLNLTIPDGSFTVLVGPSGCGKSTTLRMIAGLETQTEGEIWIGDRCMNGVEPGKRNVAMVFQNYALYPTMTVRGNIEFGLINRKVPKAERNRLIGEISEIVGLTPYLDKKPQTLSGGQRQRVALARAMVKQPAVFLMDEPLSNLDAKLRSQMRTELIQLHERLGTTFVYVTHDQVEAMSMGDYIVIMDRGVIQQVDSPMRIYDNPANLFSAQFIGSPPMNVMAIEALPELRLTSGSEVRYAGFRPEHASFVTEKKSGCIHFAARIVARELLGSEVVYRLQHPAGTFYAKQFLQPVWEAAEALVAVPYAELHYFGPEGNRTDAWPEPAGPLLVAGGSQS
jgi:sn-glycerol 3-phosphate transport system ATP-binding protein